MHPDNPRARLLRQVVDLIRGGGLIAGGVAFRIFLWLVPLGLVVAALLILGANWLAKRFGEEGLL